MKKRIPKNAFRNAKSLASQGWLKVDYYFWPQVFQLKDLLNGGSSNIIEVERILDFLVALWDVGTAPCAHPDLKEFFAARKEFFDSVRTYSKLNSKGNQQSEELLKAIQQVKRFYFPSGSSC